MQIFFYILSSLFFACTSLVLGVKNPIHSILLLILVFLMGSIFLFYLKLEFFAITLLVVYIGAIVVLFLFIIMMLDIKIMNSNQTIKDFFSYKNIIIAFIIIELLVFVNEDYFIYNTLEVLAKDDSKWLDINEYNNYFQVTNFATHIQAIGKSLFCEYKKAFILAGFILFIAMIGAIVITVEKKKFKKVKQQDPLLQSLRNSINSIYNFKVERNLKEDNIEIVK